MSGDVYSVQGHFKGVAGMDSSSFLVLKVSTREIEVVGRNATEQRRGEGRQNTWAVKRIWSGPRHSGNSSSRRD